MAKKRRKTRGYFACPHCGADVPIGDPACRECGSDAETGWSEEADKWEADIPTGYGPDEDFDYDEFTETEFPGEASFSFRRRLKKWAWRIVVGTVCIGLLLYVGARRCGLLGSESAKAGIKRLVEQQVGSLNAFSPLSLSDVQGRLRAGMAIDEFDRFVSGHNKGPNESTHMMLLPNIVGNPPSADPTKHSRIYYFRDGDLTVVLDQQEKVLSWTTEP